MRGEKYSTQRETQQSRKVRLKCSETSTSDRIFLNLEHVTIFKFTFIDNFERQKRKLILQTTERKPSHMCILLSHQVVNPLPLGPRYCDLVSCHLRETTLHFAKRGSGIQFTGSSERRRERDQARHPRTCLPARVDRSVWQAARRATAVHACTIMHVPRLTPRMAITDSR